MTARFERLGMVDQIILIGLLSTLTFLFPVSVDATSSNKTRLDSKINSTQTVNIPDSFVLPDANDINQLVMQINRSVTPEPMIIAPTPAIIIVPAVIAKPKSQPAKIVYNYPPKATAKVYMHEPEIRAYVCPRLGDNCNTFIAILKAENGTHECTRDNRGLNRNGSVDIGLAQINWNPSYNPPYSFEQLQDCRFNLDIALKKYDSRGFQPWAAYNSGSYLRHMPAVLAMADQLAAAN